MLLTTQYLDEADRLADTIAVIDHGTVIAEGTSDELKDRVGGERLEVTPGATTRTSRRRSGARGDVGERRLARRASCRTQPSGGASGAIVEAVRLLNEAGVGDRRPGDAAADPRRRLPDPDRPRAPRRWPRPRSESGAETALSDTLVLAERNLLRLPRAPDLLLAFTVQPIMFVLLFAYVFGGAIETPGYTYIDFLMPGIIVQNIAFGGFVTALGLAEDLHKGLIDRFRSLPMARAAVLAGRTLADIVTNTISIDGDARSVGIIVGFTLRHARSSRSSPGSSCCCSSATPSPGSSRSSACSVSSPEAAQLVRLHRHLPAHLHLLGLRADRLDARRRCSTFAGSTRSRSTVDAMRALWIGAPAGNNIWEAVVWSLVILAVFAPLAVRRYRRTAGQ